MKKFLRSNGIYLLAGLVVFVLAFMKQNGGLSAKEFAAKMKATPNGQVLDVRTPEEFREGYIKGAVNIDWQNDNFNQRVVKLDKTKPVFIYCRSGKRSSAAANEMRTLGFKEIYELKDGITGWQAYDMPVVK